MSNPIIQQVASTLIIAGIPIVLKVGLGMMSSNGQSNTPIITSNQNSTIPVGKSGMNISIPSI
jgi:hypothetical protein